MKLATIDLGTNTALLLIAEISNDRTIKVLRDELRSPRMGRDVDVQRKISEQSFQRVKEVFLEYKTIVEQFSVEKTIATGTSALRDAHNRDEFIARMFSETEIRIETLSGEEESLWTFRGAISGIERLQDKIAVIDIGGGSTELSVGWRFEVEGLRRKNSNHNPQTINHFSKSFDIGAVRVTEKFFPSLPPKQNEIVDARKFILQQLSEISSQQFLNSQLVGVAGTVTTLALLDQNVNYFDVAKVSNYVLNIEAIEKHLQTLSTKTPQEILLLTKAAEGRADILFAGTLILFETMKYFSWKEIIASERGLRYGIVLREFEK